MSSLSSIMKKLIIDTDDTANDEDDKDEKTGLNIYQQV